MPSGIYKRIKPIWSKGKKGWINSGSFKKGHPVYGGFKKGKHFSPETEFKKGHNRKHTEKEKKQMSIIAKQKGYGKWMIGKRLTKEHKRNIGINNRRENNASWKGGKYLSSGGYIYTIKPEHPFCNSQGYIFEHRLIMEKHIGRYLKPKEVIHHINGVKIDNKIKNLILCFNESQHRKYHLSVR